MRRIFIWLVLGSLSSLFAKISVRKKTEEKNIYTIILNAWKGNSPSSLTTKFNKALAIEHLNWHSMDFIVILVGNFSFDQFKFRSFSFRSFPVSVTSGFGLFRFRRCSFRSLLSPSIC